MLAPIAPADHRDEEKLDNFVYFHADSSPSLSQSASHARTPRDAEPTYLTHAPRFSHHLCAAEAAARPIQITIHLLLRARSAPPGYKRAAMSWQCRGGMETLTQQVGVSGECRRAWRYLTRSFRFILCKLANVLLGNRVLADHGADLLKWRPASLPESPYLFPLSPSFPCQPLSSSLSLSYPFLLTLPPSGTFKRHVL